MELTLAERAKAGLHDYAIWLRDRPSRGRGSGKSTYPTAAEASRKLDFAPSPVSQDAERAADDWLRWRVDAWTAAGRLTADGTLRLDGVRAPWTLAAVRAAFPELGRWDRWAVLILCAGECTEAEMTNDPKANIREVVQGIAEDAVRRLLRSELAAVFGEIRDEMRDETALDPKQSSILRPGKKHQVHRVRHPVTDALVSREEREKFYDLNPDFDKPCAAHKRTKCGPCAYLPQKTEAAAA